MPQATISGTASQPIPQNAQRISLLLINADGTDSIIGESRTKTASSGLTTSNGSLRLGPGAGLALNQNSDGLSEIQDAYNFIATANTPTLFWFETTNFNPRTGKFEYTEAELLQQIIQMLSKGAKVA